MSLGCKSCKHYFHVPKYDCHLCFIDYSFPNSLSKEPHSLDSLLYEWEEGRNKDDWDCLTYERTSPLDIILEGIE